MLLRPLLALSLLVLVPTPSLARSARDLSERILIDGFSGDFTDDEKLFGINVSLNALEESNNDSRWGVSNDINQIRVTWDARFLYLAGEGVIFNNNMMILVDVIPGQGLPNMSSLTAWSRNFIFSDDFRPDIFGATWDNNPRPRLLIHRGGTQINDQQSGELFTSAATFSQDRSGRSMELAIPWNTLFLGSEGLGTRDTVLTVGGQRDTFHLFPPGATLKIVGVITGGGDNTGGPDSAPDNTRGHTSEGADQVVIDNYAILELDRNDDTGLGGGGPDGVADWDVDPRSRVAFKYPPPIVAIPFELEYFSLERPAFAPDRGDRVIFDFQILPKLDPADPLTPLRTVDITANVFDMRGRFVRNIYLAESRRALDPRERRLDIWDGRDDNGHIVPAGIYIMRLVLEPNTDRINRAVVVVR